MSIFLELSLIVVLATLISFLMKFLRQPLVVGYILSGIILGPYFLDVAKSVEYIELFSKIGISILLFIVGLSLRPSVVQDVGKIAVITGVGQVIFTAFVGFIICLWLDLGILQSVFVSVAITFSSTIVILKILSDKGDLNKLYGRIALGLLLVQDIIATVAMVVISAAGASAGSSNLGPYILFLLIAGASLITLCFIISNRIISRFATFIASNSELLFMFSLAWGFGIAGLFGWIGFSIEIGALVAGITLASSPFAHEMSSRLKPLRDFFVLLFFIFLGSSLVITDVSHLVFSGVVLSIFILIGNPLIVILLMRMMKFKLKTSFEAGLTVAQISEFSLILLALASSFGFVSREILSLVTIVGIITIAVSSYLIMYSSQIYSKLEKYLKLIFKNSDVGAISEGKSDNFDIILFGFGRVGVDFLGVFESLRKKFLVVDFDPQTLSTLDDRGIPHRFGDAEDVEFLDELNLSSTSLVLSTIPDFDTNMLLLKYTKSKNSKMIVIVISHNTKEADLLYGAGATYVIMPHYLGARHASEIIKKSLFNRKSYKIHRDKHLLAIQTRAFL